MTRSEAIELLELAVLPLNTVCQPAADEAERFTRALLDGAQASFRRALGEPLWSFMHGLKEP